MTNDLKPLEDRRKGYTPPEEALRILESMEIKEGQKDERGEKEPAGLEGKVNIVLDESAADKGKNKTQDEWFDYWNKVKDGRVMASMGDLYIGFKEIRRMHEKGTEQEKTNAQTLLAGLRDEFDRPGQNNRLASSTRISYSPNNLDSKIAHHYRCSHPELVKETDLTIPVYLGVPILQVVDDSQGLNYLKTLFDTGDGAKTIIRTLEFVSGKNRDDISIWTPPLNSITCTTRSKQPDRAAGFYCYSGEFHVNGDGYLSDVGRSRGVLVNPH